MQVRHLKTWRHSPNGIHIDTYQRGEVADLPPAVADLAILEGWAVEVKARPAPENRAIDTPEVKHVGGGWYELPSGERVRGRKAALERL